MRSMLRGDEHVAAFGLREAGIQDNGGEGGENPWPGTQSVMGEIEPEDGEQTVALIAGAENSLRDIATAAGFGSRIPEGPPLHGEIHNEGDYGKSPERFTGKAARKIGEHAGDVDGMRAASGAHGGEFFEELRHAADGVDAIPSYADDDRHLENKLKEVGPKNAPESAERNVDAGERHEEEDANGEGFGIADAHGSADDVDHGLGDPAENEAVHQKAEIDGAKASEESGGLTVIAELGKLHVGDQAGAAPESREKKNGHHSGGKKAPPEPIPCYTLGVDETADGERRVRGKSGGDHGGASEPPTDLAAGNEIIAGAFAGFLAEIETEYEGDDEVASDGDPVKVGEMQSFGVPFLERSQIFS